MLGRVGKVGWAAPRDHLISTQALGAQIHPAASWGGQALGWYLVQVRYLIHRSELGMSHSRMRGYITRRRSGCMLFDFRPHLSRSVFLSLYSFCFLSHLSLRERKDRVFIRFFFAQILC